MRRVPAGQSVRCAQQSLAGGVIPCANAAAFAGAHASGHTGPLFDLRQYNPKLHLISIGVAKKIQAMLRPPSEEAIDLKRVIFTSGNGAKFQVNLS